MFPVSNNTLHWQSSAAQIQSHVARLFAADQWDPSSSIDLDSWRRIYEERLLPFRLTQGQLVEYLHFAFSPPVAQFIRTTITDRAAAIRAYRANADGGEEPPLAAPAVNPVAVEESSDEDGSDDENSDDSDEASDGDDETDDNDDVDAAVAPAVGAGDAQQGALPLEPRLYTLDEIFDLISDNFGTGDAIARSNMSLRTFSWNRASDTPLTYRRRFEYIVNRLNRAYRAKGIQETCMEHNLSVYRQGTPDYMRNKVILKTRNRRTLSSVHRYIVKLYRENKFATEAQRGSTASAEVEVARAICNNGRLSTRPELLGMAHQILEQHAHRDNTTSNANMAHLLGRVGDAFAPSTGYANVAGLHRSGRGDNKWLSHSRLPSHESYTSKSTSQRIWSSDLASPSSMRWRRTDPPLPTARSSEPSWTPPVTLLLSRKEALDTRHVSTRPKGKPTGTAPRIRTEIILRTTLPTRNLMRNRSRKRSGTPPLLARVAPTPVLNVAAVVEARSHVLVTIRARRRPRLRRSRLTLRGLLQAP